MAKQKLTWREIEDGNIMVATIVESKTDVHFDLRKLKDFDIERLKACGDVAVESFYAGMRKKLAQPTGGSANPQSKWAELMEELFGNIVETNSYAQRRQAAEKVEVSALFDKAAELGIDPEQLELLKSIVGQARVKK